MKPQLGIHLVSFSLTMLSFTACSNPVHFALQSNFEADATPTTTNPTDPGPSTTLPAPTTTLAAPTTTLPTPTTTLPPPPPTTTLPAPTTTLPPPTTTSPAPTTTLPAPTTTLPPPTTTAPAPTTTTPPTTTLPVTTTTNPVPTTTVPAPTTTVPQDTNGSQNFSQNALNGQVDILFVVDNSLSTVALQQEYAARFSDFIGVLNGMDWHIGVTTTDVSNFVYGIQGSLVPFGNCLLIGDGPQNNVDQFGNSAISSHKYSDCSGPRYISTTTPNAEALFAQTIVRPETLLCGDSPTNPCPSAWTQPMAATIMAMDKRNGDNTGFFRPGATLAVIVLSDKDEMRDGQSFGPTTPETVLSHMKGIWPEKQMFGEGIIVKPNDSQCMSELKKNWPFDIYYGTFESHLASLTNGYVGSICDTNYSANATSIATNAAQLLTTFNLGVTPVAGSVNVTLSPTQNVTWTVQGTQIVFSPAPWFGTQIGVTYKVAP